MGTSIVRICVQSILESPTDVIAVDSMFTPNFRVLPRRRSSLISMALLRQQSIPFSCPLCMVCGLCFSPSRTASFCRTKRYQRYFLTRSDGPISCVLRPHFCEVLGWQRTQAWAVLTWEICQWKFECIENIVIGFLLFCRAFRSP